MQNRDEQVRPATASLLKNQNRAMILQFLENEGPISQAELSRMTGISEPTVSECIKRFKSIGIVREAGIGISTGGRKPVLLEFNPDAAHVVGVDLGSSEVRMGITNLSGKIVRSIDTPFEDMGKGEALAKNLSAVIRRFIDNTDISSDVLAIGIAVPGVVSADGRVNIAPALGMNDFPLAERMSQNFDVPIIVENDVNAAAVAEKNWGRGRTIKDFVLLTIGSGVGAGVVLEGQLYRGSHCAAGEVGYSILDTDWFNDDRRATDFGSLERRIAVPEIMKRIRGTVSSDKIKSIGLKRVFEEGRNPDSPFYPVVKDIVNYLAAVMVNISVLLNPGAIVLGGEINEAADIILPDVEALIAQEVIYRPQILISEMGTETGIMGAASLASMYVKDLLVTTLG